MADWKRFEGAALSHEDLNQLELKINDWKVEEFDMEPSLEGPVCTVTDKGEFGMVREVGEQSAYTVLMASGPDAAGNKRRLITAYDRWASKAKQSRGLAMRLLRQRASELCAG